MKTWFLVFLILVGCKETVTETRLIESPGDDLLASPSPTPEPCAPAFNLPNAANPGSVTATNVRDANNSVLGLWVEDVGQNVWVNQSATSYFFGVDQSTGAVKGANVGLIYSDANCSSLVGEVLDYPLHLGGDIYVFHFEGDWYEYPLGGDYGIYPSSGSGYYFKTDGGSCHSCPGTVTNVREVTPSAVNGLSETYLGPITH